MALKSKSQILTKKDNNICQNISQKQALDCIWDYLTSTAFTKIKVNISDVTLNVEGHANWRREENIRMGLKAHQRDGRL